MFEIGDLVRAPIKGYPAWPAQIIDENTEHVSSEVWKAKPVDSDVAVHLVRFFGDGLQYFACLRLFHIAPNLNCVVLGNSNLDSNH